MTSAGRHKAVDYMEYYSNFGFNKKGNSPQATATAQRIERKLEELNNKLQNAVIAQVADDFMDTTTGLKNLEKAARAPPGESQSLCSLTL